MIAQPSSTLAVEACLVEAAAVRPGLHLDAVGALVRHAAGGHGAGQQRAEVDDDDAAQWALRGLREEGVLPLPGPKTTKKGGSAPCALMQKRHAKQICYIKC